MTEAHRRSVRVIVHGRVQGVGFRAWTVRTAQELDLDGFVRNRRDGSVEAAFAGASATVERMLEACRKGPPSAAVRALDVVAEAEPVQPGFRQLPTA